VTDDRVPGSRSTDGDRDEKPEPIGGAAERAALPDPVDEAIKGSFPASDPSSRWAGLDLPEGAIRRRGDDESRARP
jgi:hypothetical protein